MKLSIITLNYKTKETTLACIERVYAVYKKECDNKEIEHIVVDNYSQDTSVEFLKKEIAKRKLTHVRVIANNENAGFGKGNNVGVKIAQGEFVLFLNSDTLVKDKGFLAMMDFFATHKQIGIMGAKLLYPNGVMQLSAWKFYTPFNAFLMLLGLERFGLLSEKSKTPIRVDWVTGACMMVRKTVFEKIGMFDEKIFMYMEDMEICYRAQKQRYETYYFPQAVVEHVSQGSSNRTFAIVNIYQNLLYFYKKHRSNPEYMLIRLLLQMKARFLILYGKALAKKYLVVTYEKALTVF